MKRGIMLKQVAIAILIVIIVMVFSVAYGRFYTHGETFGIGLVEGARAFLGLEVEPHPGRLLGVDFQLRGTSVDPVVHAVLRVALPPHQHLVCGGEVQAEPHEGRRNEIVECAIPLEPTGSHGTIDLTAHTLIRGEDGEDDETFPLLESGDRTVAYVSRTLAGITAAHLVDDAVLGGPVPSALDVESSDEVSGGRELCNYMGDSCSNVDHPLCTPEYNVEGVRFPNPLFAFWDDYDCPEDGTVRHCLDTVYLPALRERLSLCDLRSGVWATSGHFIIAGGTGGGYTHVSPARRGFFVDEGRREITAPVTTDEEIVPFVMLVVPDGETVEQVTVELVSSQGYARDVTLSYVFSPGESEDYSGYGHDVYRADPLEDLPAGVYDVVLRVRDAHTVRVFDGTPLVVFRDLPYEHIRPWFHRAIPIQVPEDPMPPTDPEDPEHYYVPDQVIFSPRVDDHRMVTVELEAIRASTPDGSFAWVPGERHVFGNREIESYSLIEAHEIVDRYRGGFEPLGPIPSVRTEDHLALYERNAALAQELAQELGFDRPREQRTNIFIGRYEPNLLDFNRWAVNTFGISFYSNDGVSVAFWKHNVIHPRQMDEFLDAPAAYDPIADESRSYATLFSDEDTMQFSEDRVVLARFTFDADDHTDTITLNPFMFSPRDVTLNEDCSLYIHPEEGWRENPEHACGSGYCIPVYHLPWSESALSIEDSFVQLQIGVCMDQAERGMFVYDERLCESGVTERPVTSDRWARCV